jgi:hypothetical protein
VLCCAADVTAEEFKKNYEAGTIAALSEVTGVPASAITATIEQPAAAAAPAGRGNRRLLQDAATGAAAAAAGGPLRVKFDLQTPDAAATTAKLGQALQNNGDSFYQVRAWGTVWGCSL